MQDVDGARAELISYSATAGRGDRQTDRAALALGRIRFCFSRPCNGESRVRRHRELGM